MFSRIHPFVVAMFCIFSALGHSPAWMHIADCRHSFTLDQDHQGNHFTPTHSHCCDHQHHPPLGKAENKSRRQGEVPCDQDACAICHSLTCPVGSGWTPLVCSVSVGVAFRTTILSTTITQPLWVAVANPRGPPSQI